MPVSYPATRRIPTRRPSPSGETGRRSVRRREALPASFTLPHAPKRQWTAGEGAFVASGKGTDGGGEPRIPGDPMSNGLRTPARFRLPGHGRLGCADAHTRIVAAADSTFAPYIQALSGPFREDLATGRRYCFYQCRVDGLQVARVGQFPAESGRSTRLWRSACRRVYFVRGSTLFEPGRWRLRSERAVFGIRPRRRDRSNSPGVPRTKSDGLAGATSILVPAEAMVERIPLVHGVEFIIATRPR